MKSTIFNTSIIFLRKLILSIRRSSLLFIMFINILNNATAGSPNIQELERNLRYAVVGSEWKETIIAADELLKYKPKDASAHYEKGVALSQLGKDKEAIVAFDLAIKYKYKYLSCSYFEKANSLRALNMLEEALQCYTKAIRLGYDHRSVYHYRDEVLSELGRLGKGLDPI